MLSAKQRRQSNAKTYMACASSIISLATIASVASPVTLLASIKLVAKIMLPSLKLALKNWSARTARSPVDSPSLPSVLAWSLCPSSPCSFKKLSYWWINALFAEITPLVSFGNCELVIRDLYAADFLGIEKIQNGVPWTTVEFNGTSN